MLQEDEELDDVGTEDVVKSQDAAGERAVPPARER